MNPRKLWGRLGRGHFQNIDFRDFCRLIEAFGFELQRQRGSHHVYARDESRELVNVQPRRDGSAKAYQVEQFRKLVREYDLSMKQGRGSSDD